MPAKRSRRLRKPVPGVNPPRLATTWRETTSSRGAENTFMIGVQGKSNDATASTSNVSSSNTVADGLESLNFPHAIECESSPVPEFNATGEERTAHPSIRTLDRLSGTEGGQLWSLGSMDLPLESLSNFEDNWQSNITSNTFEGYQRNYPFNSRSEPAAGSSGSIAHSNQNSSLIEPLESNLGGDLFDNTFIYPSLNEESDFISPQIRIPELNAPSPEVGRALEQGEIGIQTGTAQLKFCCPKTNYRFNVEEPPQDVLQYSLSELQSENSSSLLLPQPSTPSTFCTGWSDNAQRFKTHDSAIFLNAKHNTRKPAYASRALQSLQAVEPNLGFSTLSPIDQPNEMSSDTRSNKVRIVPRPDWLQGIDSHENFNRSTTSNNPCPCIQNQPDISAQMTLQAGPRFSTKLLHLKNGSRNNDFPVMVVMEDTNATQPEVQEFLAKANQHSKPLKSKSSSNSPSRKAELAWEHVFIPKTHFIEAESEPPLKSSTLKGIGRTRPLKVETRAKAKEVRKIGSCMRCRVAKIAVSYNFSF
ncbi:hypothetical protein BGZ60DRAFT_157347 [Tricladium varicosporioides]|nr:hypothetical protein BGZ60DRAFT_157347 [Hymenoscyphus varicosporioides]